MSTPEDKLPEELKPYPTKIWDSIYGDLIQTPTVTKICEEVPLVTMSPPPPNPFETCGTIYSNGLVLKRYCGVESDPLVTVSEGRTRLTVNLETLRKDPGNLELVIRLLYSSLRP